MRQQKRAPEFKTYDAEWEYIASLSRHFDHSGYLYSPQSVWFKQPPDINELQNICKQLCQWLGIKPRQLQVTFSSELGNKCGRFIENDDGFQIIISQSYAETTYQLIAILAHELCHYIVESRWRLSFDTIEEKECFIDLASIYFGFGALILNGLDRQNTWWNTLLVALRLKSYKLSMGFFSPQEYAYHLGHFITSSQHSSETDLYTQLAPWTLSLFHSKRSEHVTVAPYIAHTVRRNHLANIVLALVFGLSLMIFGSFVVFSRAQLEKPSDKLITLKEQIDTLGTSYQLCLQEVTARQSAISKPDILVQQSLSNDQQRCLSIKNEYYAAVSQYNQLVAQQK